MRSVTLVAFVISFAACAGELEEPQRFSYLQGGAGTPGSLRPGATGAAACDAPALLRASCASCHSAASPSGELALDGADLLGTLRDKPARGGPGVLVAPGKPGDSVLVRKLRGPAPFGGIMPPGPPLSDEAVACITSWVAESR